MPPTSSVAVYNFLVTSRLGAWDSRMYEMPRERFCQRGYTSDAVAARFSTLSAEAIAELKSCPTLFAYEGMKEEMRVGYLREISERGNMIYVEFEFEERVEPIPFAKIDPLRLRLNIKDRNELGTTHWAIKSEDLFRVLFAAGLVQAPAPAATLGVAVPQQAVDPSQTSQVEEFDSLTIMFLDVKGYSKSEMSSTKQYITKVLPRINELLRNAIHRNTWGDAVLATFRREEDGASAALAIRDMFVRLPGDVLPAGLVPRIALNRGQVLVCHNPIRNAPDIFGPAVNLAARLEPITVPGQVFCTDPVARALSDMGSLGSKATLYQTQAELPKDFGRCDVYVVTHRNESPLTEKS